MDGKGNDRSLRQKTEPPSAHPLPLLHELAEEKFSRAEATSHFGLKREAEELEKKIGQIKNTLEKSTWGKNESFWWHTIS